MNVLLVDDNTLLREGLQSLLDDIEGINVIGEAENGEEAVAKARELYPDIVLMDLAMPICGGIEATRRLHAKCPDLPVLIFASEAEAESINDAIGAGAKGYLLKHTSLRELVNAMRAVYDGNSYFHPVVAKVILDGIIHPERRAVRPDTLFSLSEREVQVLRLIAEGLNNQEIAEQLFISIKTVQTHRRNIMEKLDLHDRVDLVKYALKKGIIGLDRGV